VDTDRLTAGLIRVAVAARTDADDGLERTIGQQQVLLLLSRQPREYALSELAAALGMPLAATQAAVTTLCKERLTEMGPAPSYSPHEVRVALTERGRAQAPEFLSWADNVLSELDQLDEAEQAEALRVATDQIRAMQQRGEIPITRMCVTCRFFDGYAHAGSPEPHHCWLVDAPFGYRQLRLRCPEQEPRQ
jgi:DNA-binding MarR family transcriptional regulator